MSGVRIKQQRDSRKYMNRRSAPPLLLLLSLSLSLSLAMPVRPSSRPHIASVTD